MLASRVRSFASGISGCAVVIALCLGCGETLDEASETAGASVCTSVGTSTWWNQSFPDWTGRFHVEFDVTPSVGNLDGTIGLSAGTATKWSQLAAIVRFNPQGYVDARAGSAYRADTSFRYAAGETYHVRLDVDVEARTYSTFIAYGAGTITGYYAIGRDYPFRTEQAGATHLNNISAFVNPQTGPGYLTICNWGFGGDQTTADGCTVNTAGTGFVNMNVLPSPTVQRIAVQAIPKNDNIDAVVGVTPNGATSYNDLAASIRFYTNGVLEARDGDTYRADAVVPYHAGENFDLRFVIDMPSKTYSVYVENGFDLNRITLARNYKFRPSQASATSLGTVSTIVASSSGRLDACNPSGGQHYKLVSARGGTWHVKPLADGGALMSDGATTARVDSNNVPRGSVAAGGKVAADSSGNFYLASVANGALTVRAYTAAFALRWTSSLQVADTDVADIAVTNRGHVAMALGSKNGSDFFPTRVVRYDSYGRYLSTTNLFAGATAIAMATNHYTVATPISGGVQVEVWGYETNQLQRTRQFIGPIDISRMAIAADDSIVIGGHLTSLQPVTSTFEDCTLQAYAGTEVYWNAYVTALRPDLSVRFCDRLTDNTEGIATDGSKIAVSYLEWTQLHYVDLHVYNTDGTLLQSSVEDAFVGPFGFPGSIALGTTGQLYLNETASFEGPGDGHVPLLVTLRL
jgi:hypothetical protein